MPLYMLLMLGNSSEQKVHLTSGNHRVLPSYYSLSFLIPSVSSVHSNYQQLSQTASREGMTHHSKPWNRALPVGTGSHHRLNTAWGPTVLLTPRSLQTQPPHSLRSTTHLHPHQPLTHTTHHTNQTQPLRATTQQLLPLRLRILHLCQRQPLRATMHQMLPMWATNWTDRTGKSRAQVRIRPLAVLPVQPHLFLPVNEKM